MWSFCKLRPPPSSPRSDVSRRYEQGKADQGRKDFHSIAGNQMTSLPPPLLSLLLFKMSLARSISYCWGSAEWETAKQFKTTVSQQGTGAVGPARLEHHIRGPLSAQSLPFQASIHLRNGSLLCGNEHTFSALLHNVCVLAGQRRTEPALGRRAGFLRPPPLLL